MIVLLVRVPLGSLMNTIFVRAALQIARTRWALFFACSGFIVTNYFSAGSILRRVEGKNEEQSNYRLIKF